ncbi:Basic-leucine zipper (bZIP) [Gracilaria domingensis]|nr:Basic-leucine zipper (bZIP) [Gracilaria domingensis]
MRLEPFTTESKEELTMDISPFALDLSLSDLPYDFIHPQVPCADIRPPFDSWLEDPPNEALLVTEAFSDISSEESKPPAFVPLPPLQAPVLALSQPEQPAPFTSTTSSSTLPTSPKKMPSSPVNSECAIKTEEVHIKSKDTTATSNRATTANSQPSQSEIDSHKKRQADRAARNRESSRRAREKQKNRFIQLQNGNLLLQQTLQRYKLQVEHLQSSIERMHVMLSSCSMCSYNAALAQQQQKQPQPPQQPPQQSSQQPTQAQTQPHGATQTHSAPTTTLLRQ